MAGSFSTCVFCMLVYPAFTPSLFHSHFTSPLTAAPPTPSPSLFPLPLSLLAQNVTLGGTGKDHGDRHPKISDNVLIGACATVLGNIRVGEGAQIAAGSLVLKPVAPHTMVAGSPAKPVGHVTGGSAQLTVDA